MYLIFLILLWVVLAVWTLLFFAMDVTGAAATLWVARRIKSTAIRYLIYAIILAVCFVPTCIPYDWATATQGLKESDLLFTFGRGLDGQPPRHFYLASYALVKGLLTGKPYLIEAGGVPLFLAVASIWCCSVALKYLWPTVTFGMGAYAHLYGWSLFHQASLNSNKVTLDPFVLAIALWTSGVTLCAGAVIQTGLWIYRQLNNREKILPPNPSEPKPLPPK